MNSSEINTIILVDDKDSNYKSGGNGSPIRNTRYAILLSVLKNKLEKLDEAYLVLGDGIYKYDFKENCIQNLEKIQMFSGSDNAQQILKKIKKLADKKNTLLLIDYMLNKSSGMEKEGKQLACKILKSVSNLGNIIKLLYSTSPEKKRETKDFQWASVFDFPIDSPTDAADEIIYALKNRGDLCV